MTHDGRDRGADELLDITLPVAVGIVHHAHGLGESPQESLGCHVLADRDYQRRGKVVAVILVEVAHDHLHVRRDTEERAQRLQAAVGDPLVPDLDRVGLVGLHPDPARVRVRGSIAGHQPLRGHRSGQGRGHGAHGHLRYSHLPPCPTGGKLGADVLGEWRQECPLANHFHDVDRRAYERRDQSQHRHGVDHALIALPRLAELLGEGLISTGIDARETDVLGRVADNFFHAPRHGIAGEPLQA